MRAYYERVRDNIDFIYYFEGANKCLPHFHQHLEMLYVVSGSQIVHINDITAEIHAGEMCVADSLDVHYYEKSEAITRVLVLPQRLLRDFNNFRKSKTFQIKIILAAQEIGQMLTEFSKEQESLYLQGIVDILLSKVIACSGLVLTVKNAAGNIIRDILTYIDIHYAEPLSLETLAKHFSYSKTHFSHLFHKHFGINLNDYVNLVRIDYLVERKKANPTLSTIDLAFSVGFESAATFYRAFTKQHGVSPKKYF